MSASSDYAALAASGASRSLSCSHRHQDVDRRQYNTCVSLSGAFRYAWQLLGGGGSMLKVGDPAPEFDVTDHHGRRVKLSDLRGKKVVLWFFPKADTPG